MAKTAQWGVVDIKGKPYKQVVLRLLEFREAHPDWTIDTQIIESMCLGSLVTMRCEIRDPDGRLIAAGHAEEDRSFGMINKTSALENCETSAVGRALSFYGLAGEAIASHGEVAIAIKKQEPAISKEAALRAELNGKIKADSLDGESVQRWVVKNYSVSPAALAADRLTDLLSRYDEMREAIRAQPQRDNTEVK